MVFRVSQDTFGMWTRIQEITLSYYAPSGFGYLGECTRNLWLGCHRLTILCTCYLESNIAVYVGMMIIYARTLFIREGVLMGGMGSLGI